MSALRAARRNPSRRTALRRSRVSSLGRVSDGTDAESLFTYGTLQSSDVQLDTFGRRVDGDDDALTGFRLEWIDATGVHDPGGVDTASALADRHRALRRTDDPRDRVFGSVLQLTADELDAADEYMATVSRRTRVTLSSGAEAWVYVAV